MILVSLLFLDRLLLGLLIIQKEAQLFLNRIAEIGNKIGVDLSMRKFKDDDIIPPFINCLYHNKRLDLYQHRL